MMSLASIKKHALLAAVAIALPGAALAQNDVADRTEKVNEAAQQLEQEAGALDNAVADDAAAAATTTDADADVNDRDHDDDGDEGKLGLLGLLGLAGLLGLKRREPDLRDDRRTTTGDTTRTDRDTRL